MVLAAVLVGESGDADEPRTWVRQARRAAARDLITLLNDQPLIDRIVVVSPSWRWPEPGSRVTYIRSAPGPIHVGRQLASLVRRYGPERLLYFGGGSAPLLTAEILADLVDQLAEASSCVLTNNQFASDWAGVTPATAVIDWQERLPLDNMLGWVLSTEAGLPLHTLPAGATSRLDIDTPTDLLTLRLHAGPGPYLKGYLSSLPLDTSRFEASLQVLSSPASHVFMSGRIGPEAWQAINRATRCWIRVISEERGMVSSGRLQRGEVYSFLADHVERVGFERFFASLALQSQAAFLDSRVMMAHHGRWPPERERFASDLGRVDEIEDPWLRAFTDAAMSAPIPVVLGGHGLLSGDLFAIAELLSLAG